MSQNAVNDIVLNTTAVDPFPKSIPVNKVVLLHPTPQEGLGVIVGVGVKVKVIDGVGVFVGV